MSEIELAAGTVEYRDTGGDGPVLVLLHGLLMDASLWDATIAGLSGDYRCVAPTLPLGEPDRARLLRRVRQLPARPDRRSPGC
jgi:hypothetical protein